MFIILINAAVSQATFHFDCAVRSDFPIYFVFFGFLFAQYMLLCGCERMAYLRLLSAGSKLTPENK